MAVGIAKELKRIGREKQRRISAFDRKVNGGAMNLDRVYTSIRRFETDEDLASATIYLIQQTAEYLGVERTRRPEERGFTPYITFESSEEYPNVTVTIQTPFYRLFADGGSSFPVNIHSDFLAVENERDMKFFEALKRLHGVSQGFTQSPMSQEHPYTIVRYRFMCAAESSTLLYDTNKPHAERILAHIGPIKQDIPSIEEAVADYNDYKSRNPHKEWHQDIPLEQQLGALVMR